VIPGTLLERLQARITRLGAPLCLGIDPHPDHLPDALPRSIDGVESFARGVLEAAGDEVVAVKVNVAFFEAFGSDGLAALERLRGDVPEDLLFILDAKRGDIGSTAERYAEAIFGRLAADAVTVSPYLGEDAIEPFLAFEDRVVYVLAHSSNPSAGRLQDVVIDGRSLAEHVARWVATSWTDARVGLVVGATAPGELRRLRDAAPAPGFLVPGVGAQGGDLDTAVACCHGTRAPGVVSVSRAIAGASRGADWRDAAASSASQLRDRMREAGATLGR
jgi:orotidine 5'-phosphate decarboxylase subfamily 2